MIIVNGWKPLTIITKYSILDVAASLDPPLKRTVSAELRSVLSLSSLQLLSHSLSIFSSCVSSSGTNNLFLSFNYNLCLCYVRSYYLDICL